MKHLKFYLFIMIMFLAPNVYAQEFNVSSSDVSCPLTSGSGKYCGAEVYYYGTSGAYNLGTRYDGRLNRIWFNLSAGGYADANGFEKGHTYTVSMNMATNDWNNKFGSLSVKCEGSSGTELKKGSVTYVSYKKIKFSFQAPSDAWCQFVYVDIRASSGNTITQISNWNLSSLTISDSAYSSGGSSGGGSGTPSPTTDPNQSIIDANNQNTTDIINNNNQNTNDIIDNINEASSTITDSLDEMLGNKCANIFGDYIIKEGYIDNGPNRFTLISTYNRLAFVPAQPSTTYTISRKVKTGTFRVTSYSSIPTSNGDYTVTNIVKDNNASSITYTTGPNDHYLIIHYGHVNNDSSTIEDSLSSIMVNEGSTSKAYCEYGSYSSKLDDTNKEIEELNDKLDGLTNVIENSQVDDKSSFFTGFQDNNHGLTGIITAPLTTIQGLANTSCVPLAIPIPYTQNFVNLPCMTQVYQNYVPSVFSIWQGVSFGIISYFICIDIFKMVKGFKDPNEDKVEVLDL